MGLIKAFFGAANGTFADQWKEFFYCDSLQADVLVARGQKQVGKRSSNKRGNDNIISNGSGIAVADGQCMIIVDQGKVVEFCAEPGEYTYDTSSEPSIFTGSLGKGIVDTFKTIGKRFTYGGDTGKDQRVYYFNTKEILENKFGTPTPILFRVLDQNIGLDIDVSVRCSGVYSYKITNPLLFYTNVCGNVSDEYRRSDIDTQLKTEFVSALQPAFGKLSSLGLRPTAIPAHVDELCSYMNDTLTEKWENTRGIKVISIAMNPVSLPEEDAELIKTAQKNAILRDPTMAAATLAGAQADAMKAAAENKNGAMAGFMGLGMATNAGGANMSDLFTMGRKDPAPKKEAFDTKVDSIKSGDVWKCSCGCETSGKFCPECGQKRPESGWVCSCGHLNKGKFCSECGKKKPASEPLYRCDKCGWEPEDPKNPPRFCPECGDRFDDNDIK